MLEGNNSIMHAIFQNSKPNGVKPNRNEKHLWANVNVVSVELKFEFGELDALLSNLSAIYTLIKLALLPIHSTPTFLVTL